MRKFIVISAFEKNPDQYFGGPSGSRKPAGVGSPDCFTSLKDARNELEKRLEDDDGWTCAIYRRMPNGRGWKRI